MKDSNLDAKERIITERLLKDFYPGSKIRNHSVKEVVQKPDSKDFPCEPLRPQW
jgi:hypothetical protein